MKQRYFRKLRIIPVLSLTFSNRALLTVSLRFIRHICSEFFLPQFHTKFKLKKIPVVNVGHPLDKLIPYTPGKITVYMNFTNYWLNSLLYVRALYGEKVLSEITGYIDIMDRLYIEAGAIYKTLQSTTRRPTCLRHPMFWLVYLADPHLHCAPSLHVMDICFTYHWVSRILKKQGGDTGNFEKMLFKEGVEIIESVLLTKQHSINCIASGLFMLTTLVEGFNENLAEKYIHSLFKERGEEIRATEKQFHHVLAGIYRGLMEKHYRSGRTSPRKTMLEFLRTFPPAKTWGG